MKKQTVPGEWLYLAKVDVKIRQIAEAVEGKHEYEIWDEAGVLEIMLSETATFDMEHVQIHPKDALTREFVEKEGYREVFLVTFKPEEYAAAQEVMHEIITTCGGMFCGDTEDFSPIVRG